jgi:pimeloyl-ACP methyl ester carboxylesterase
VFDEELARRWQSMIPHSTWDGFDDAGHFLQDIHGHRIAEITLGYAR